jgi:O-acetyl-ADP-ribose deacetylase (regulator of RNase III)
MLVRHDLKTIAFCCISAGVFGFPLLPATHIALATVRRWMEVDGNADRVERIVFACFKQEEYDTYLKIAQKYFPLS